MYLTVHALTGALIGKQIVSPLLAFGLGFLSHFVLDVIPHSEAELWDKDKTKFPNKTHLKRILGVILIDATILAISLTIILVILYRKGEIINSFAVISGIFGSLLPDFLTGIFLLSKGRFFKKFTDFHRTIHFSPKKSQFLKINGYITQLIVSIITIGFLL